MKQLFALFSLFFLLSCGQVPLVTSNAENNDTYKVDYLFEHEGCKVYRFRDNGNYIYFTNCTGNVTVALKDSTDSQIQTIIQTTPVIAEK